MRVFYEQNTYTYIYTYMYIDQNTYNYTYVYNFDQNVDSDILERSVSVLSSASTVEM